MRIVPAELAFDAAGTPYSPAYGDVYHSADSGPGQAEHVFLAGNGLPQAWAHARRFVILETGFGLGLNFFATWRAWRADPARPTRLHFVSIEKHPFEREALARLHARYEGFASLAAELGAAWPVLVPGLHRLEFESGRVILTLAFGDAGAILPRLRLRADAIYLDGFAPRANADMWSPQLMKALARLSRLGATAATYTCAASVREALDAAGFVTQKRPGFGRKRDMLSARYAPRWQPRRLPRATAEPEERRAIVVGAGLAGAALSERLAARGWAIELIERRRPAAHGAVKYAGVFHPHLSRDDCMLSRAARNGFLYAVARWRALERSGGRFAWSRCGVLQLEGAALRRARLEDCARGYPADYARYVDRGEAEQLAGCKLPVGGAWFPGAGWMRPTELIAAQLAAAGPGLRPHFGVEAAAIVREGERWVARDAQGALIAAAPLLILANSNDMTRFCSLAQALARIRGQVSYLPAAGLAAPRTVLTGSGYLLPETDGIVVTGSTYERDDADPEPRASGHAANLARAAKLIPEAARVDPATLEGAVGFRCVAPDRMPLVGALPDVEAARADKANLSGAQFDELPRAPGAYCASGFASRGLVWAALAGELLASQIEGEPLPLEGDLADAVDPARFALKRLRHLSL